MHRLALTLAVVVALIAACGPDTWEGFVYPDRENLANHRSIGSFESLEACRASARSYLADISSLERGDYECGLNCKDSSDFPGIRVCKETVR